MAMYDGSVSVEENDFDPVLEACGCGVLVTVSDDVCWVVSEICSVWNGHEHSRGHETKRDRCWSSASCAVGYARESRRGGGAYAVASASDLMSDRRMESDDGAAVDHHDDLCLECRCRLHAVVVYECHHLRDGVVVVAFLILSHVGAFDQSRDRHGLLLYLCHGRGRYAHCVLALWCGLVLGRVLAQLLAF